MSEKKQTPLQEAIQKLLQVRDKALEKGFGDRANAYQWSTEYLQSLLPKEKAFAEEAFGWGMAFKHNGNEDINDFYKQYENEQT